ncbi:hypothetical protein MSAN_00762400 [Mycena sanguinolenta]|uniref:Uncharacterized protein n=1 Tax=Mycena sanguinolenta TaxID=230812 RepID=A0A8H6Z6K2_9AGAR|nr:hypothetical protein MSAN_00762400 [Mycena sanguinolenta]
MTTNDIGDSERRTRIPTSSPHIASVVLSQRLSALLSRSPHLADHIRTLNLYYNATTTEANFIPQILAAVTGLTGLTLSEFLCGFFPMDPLTIAPFSLPSLRRVELNRYQFQNAFDLESLLSKAKCLKELTLKGIRFEEFNTVDGEAVLPRPIDGTSDHYTRDAVFGCTGSTGSCFCVELIHHCGYPASEVSFHSRFSHCPSPAGKRSFNSKTAFGKIYL